MESPRGIKYDADKASQQTQSCFHTAACLYTARPTNAYGQLARTTRSKWIEIRCAFAILTPVSLHDTGTRVATSQLDKPTLRDLHSKVLVRTTCQELKHLLRSSGPATANTPNEHAARQRTSSKPAARLATRRLTQRLHACTFNGTPANAQ